MVFDRVLALLQCFAVRFELVNRYSVCLRLKTKTVRRAYLGVSPSGLCRATSENAELSCGLVPSYALRIRKRLTDAQS